MRNMKKTINESLKKVSLEKKKEFLNPSINSICTFFWYEPTHPKTKHVRKKNDT